MVLRSGTDGKETRPAGSPTWSMSGLLGWGTWTIVQKIDISHTTPHSQRERYNNLLYLRSVSEDKQPPLLPQRPGYQDAKKALVDMHKLVRQDCGVPFIPKVERHRLQNQLDPSMQQCRGVLSTNWAEYFAEEKHQPTSSSSSTPGSSYWPRRVVTCTSRYVGGPVMCRGFVRCWPLLDRG